MNIMYEMLHLTINTQLYSLTYFSLALIISYTQTIKYHLTESEMFIVLKFNSFKSNKLFEKSKQFNLPVIPMIHKLSLLHNDLITPVCINKAFYFNSFFFSLYFNV